MQLKKLSIPASLTRAGFITEETNGEKKSKRITISSDVPYLRYDWKSDEPYYEVLSHAPGDIDESRLKAGLSSLYNHNRDFHLARATKYENDGHRLNVGTLDDLIWSEGRDAQEKKKDVENGSLVGTSVGYSIESNGRQIGEKDGIPVISFKWAPYEFSFCPIEADITVGAGRQRNKGDSQETIEITIDSPEKPDTRTTTDMKITPGVRKHLEADNGGNATTGSATANTVDLAAERKSWQESERKRVKDINDYVGAFKITAMKAKVAELGRKAIEDGTAMHDFEKSVIANWNESRADIEDDSHRSQIEVVGERRQNGQRALSIGAQFIRSKDFQERGKQTGRRRAITIDTDMSVIGIRGKVALAQRAGFNSSDLSAINVAPIQQLVGLGVQRLTVMDLIAGGTTGAAAIPYPVETTLGTVDGIAQTLGKPLAGMVGERGLKPLWEPDITTETASVKKIAIITKVPDEFLADFPGFQSYIDERLPFMVDTKAEQQILYGDGIGNNIKGITTFAGVQARAYATSWADTIRKAITDVEVGSFFTVDGIVMHPYDWEVASLEKDVNGQYLAGGPFYIPYGNGVFIQVRTFWGKMVVTTTACTVGQPIVGAWKLGAQFFIREGMRLETTNSNEDDFRKNLIAVRAEERGALAVYRPISFLEVTGGPART